MNQEIINHCLSCLTRLPLFVNSFLLHCHNSSHNTYLIMDHESRKGNRRNHYQTKLNNKVLKKYLLCNNVVYYLPYTFQDQLLHPGQHRLRPPRKGLGRMVLRKNASFRQSRKGNINNIPRHHMEKTLEQLLPITSILNRPFMIRICQRHRMRRPNSTL